MYGLYILTSFYLDSLLNSHTYIDKPETQFYGDNVCVFNTVLMEIDMTHTYVTILPRTRSVYLSKSSWKIDLIELSPRDKLYYKNYQINVLNPQTFGFKFCFVVIKKKFD